MVITTNCNPPHSLHPITLLHLPIVWWNNFDSATSVEWLEIHRFQSFDDPSRQYGQINTILDVCTTEISQFNEIFRTEIPKQIQKDYKITIPAKRRFRQKVLELHDQHHIYRQQKLPNNEIFDHCCVSIQTQCKELCHKTIKPHPISTKCESP